MRSLDIFSDIIVKIPIFENRKIQDGCRKILIFKKIGLKWSEFNDFNVYS